jgi:hypothetical protein
MGNGKATSGFEPLYTALQIAQGRETGPSQ